MKAIGPLVMEILHFEDLGDTSVISECSLGDNLVIDILHFEDLGDMSVVWLRTQLF